MTNRSSAVNLPQAPIAWTASDRETWSRLISELERSPLFNRGRRSAPQFLIQGSVSAAVTLDVDTPDLDALTHIVARLLVALNQLPQVDVRT